MLVRSGHDPYEGWLTINKQLLGASQFELAQHCLSMRRPEWVPDPDLFELILTAMCSMTEDRTQLYQRIIEEAATPEDVPEDTVEEAEEDEEELQSIAVANFQAAVLVLTEHLSVSNTLILT